MGKLLEIVKNPSVVGGYINGVVNAITNRKNIYYLTFHRKIDGGWYIYLPTWKGSQANLAMVAGSDLLLDHLHKAKNRVDVEVVKSDKPLENMNDYFLCEQLEMSVFGGATYKVCGVEGFDRTIWICPVTLYVLGEYPKFIYIRQTK